MCSINSGYLQLPATNSTTTSVPATITEVNRKVYVTLCAVLTVVTVTIVCANNLATIHFSPTVTIICTNNLATIHSSSVSTIVSTNNYQPRSCHQLQAVGTSISAVFGADFGFCKHQHWPCVLPNSTSCEK